MPDPATLEDVVKLLDSKPSPFDLAKHVDVFAQGMHDLKDRLANLEHTGLEVQHRLTLVEGRLADAETRAAGYAKDRDEYKNRLTAIEKTPVDIKAQLEAIEKRLRQVEGAVGSKNFQAPAKPVEPDAAVPKPGFFSRTPEPVPA